MKKLLLAILPILLTVSYSYAQNTAWPSTTSNNNVGIGTTTANQKLTINGGGIGFDWNSTDKKLYSPADGDLEWVTQNGAGVHGFAVSSNGNRIVYFNTNGYSYLNGGNVGIGTPNPGSLLSIIKNVTGVSIDPIGNPYYGTIAFNREAATGAIFDPSGYAFQINNGGTDPNLHFQVWNRNGTLVTNNALVIAGANGNVGIGTATPDQLLSVKGTIHSQTVLVDMIGWNDYVFEPDYKLASLKDVKSYIEKNHHLPDVPSESEIIQQGLDLGKIDAIQTKKIEELTLYLIEKDKQVSEQSKQICGLKGEVDELKAQVKQLLNLCNKK